MKTAGSPKRRTDSKSARKAVRFGDLVRASGRPQVVTLWRGPQRDQNFRRAIKGKRVLTIIQEPAGQRKDFGQIGFHRAPHASYFVFPRRLMVDARARIVGINYELLEPD